MEGSWWGGGGGVHGGPPGFLTKRERERERERERVASIWYNGNYYDANNNNKIYYTVAYVCSKHRRYQFLQRSADVKEFLFCCCWFFCFVLFVFVFVFFLNRLVGCLSMIVWTHAVLGIFYACVSYLHLFRATEYVLHGKAL